MSIKERTSDTISNITTVEEPQGSGTSRIALLAIGDALVFVIFAVIGMRSHKVSLTVPSVLQTAAPFAIGWFLVSPFVGAFRRKIISQPSKMSLRTALGWLIAWPIGLLLRGIVEHEIPPLSFAIVTLITNTIFLQLWRVPFAWFTRRGHAHDARS
jgi:Protein of unknown function (DUF3054)